MFLDPTETYPLYKILWNITVWKSLIVLTLTLSLHLPATSNPWPFYSSLSYCLKNFMNLSRSWSYWWMLAGNLAAWQWYNEKKNFILSLCIIYRWLLDRWTSLCAYKLIYTLSVPWWKSHENEAFFTLPCQWWQLVVFIFSSNIFWL